MTAGTDDVERYLASAPAPMRPALARLREAVRAAAPRATESISYQIPTFSQDGPLVAYAAWKKHIGLYVMSDAVMATHRDELAGYDTQKATVRFPPDSPPPDALIAAIVRERIAENAAAAERRKAKKLAAKESRR
jgi:uncharacterized protein YdhG (YjbR/CyaY superfamily)